MGCLLRRRPAPARRAPPLPPAAAATVAAAASCAPPQPLLPPPTQPPPPAAAAVEDGPVHSGDWLFDTLPADVAAGILARLGARQLASGSTVSRAWAAAAAARLRTRLEFDDAGSVVGLSEAALAGLIRRSGGELLVLRLPARCPAAAALEAERRFAAGLRGGGPCLRGGRAAALAALLPRLQEIVLDERCSCIGGMTDDLARALASRCPDLRRLGLHFRRYSPAAELLTNAGVIALAEGCRRLEQVSLTNADVTSGCLYALAAHSGSLAALSLSGYLERVDVGGFAVLFAARGPALRELRLGAKLAADADGVVAALGAHCGPGLRAVRLPAGVGDAAFLALLAAAPGLEELDARACGGLSAGAIGRAAAVLRAGGARFLPPRRSSECGGGSGDDSDGEGAGRLCM